MFEEWANQLANLNTYLKSNMVYAQAAHSEHADKDRLPAPAYKTRDEVWLLRQHIQTTHPSSKLDFKRLGRFKIIQKISSHAYKLDLPTSMKCHPVSFVSLFEPAATPQSLDRNNLPHLLSSSTTILNSRVRSYLIPSFSEKL